MDLLKMLKPRASKRSLLFIAALVWTIAGVMLLVKGFSLSGNICNPFIIKILSSLTGGILFYLILFSKISLKHVKRIINLQNEDPCLFSFFSIRSYLLMALMITSGILLRTSGIVPPEYLSIFYIIMGIPLLLSAVRFYYHGFFYVRNASPQL